MNILTWTLAFALTVLATNSVVWADSGQIVAKSNINDLCKSEPATSRKTIIYAPAFNEGASMREFGEEIIAVICGLDGFNVLAKLAIDCWLPNMVAYWVPSSIGKKPLPASGLAGS